MITNSVGYVQVSSVTAAYYGTQQTTTNNHGAEVYGGSELRVVRGGSMRCSHSISPRDLRDRAGRVYDDAADRCFPGFFASRRNYDVAQASMRRDAAAQACSSNRGGWAAPQARRSPHWNCFVPTRSCRVRAVTREVYGDAAEPAANATVYFRASIRGWAP